MANDLEEDPIEKYKRDFKQRKIEEAREKARKQAKSQAQWYKFVRVLLYPVAIFSILVILDFFLPVNTESDYPLTGYQMTVRHRLHRSHVESYMKTSHHEFEIPNQLHLDYDYYADQKKLIHLEFTPLFKTLKRIGVDQGNYILMFDAPGSIYFIIYLPIPYVLLLLSVLFIKKKEYTVTRYYLSFMPLVIALIFITMMVKMHV